MKNKIVDKYCKLHYFLCLFTDHCKCGDSCYKWYDSDDPGSYTWSRLKKDLEKIKK